MDKEGYSWEKLSENQKQAVSLFSSEYRDFLDGAKTERETTKTIIDVAKNQGFKPLEQAAQIKTGDKVYFNYQNKALCLAIVGKRPLTDGLKLIGSHMDAPRLDLKQNPLYEESGLALFKTHYYGGIKKYQWTAVPLALHGVICTADGKAIEVTVGENEDDPVFTITDLLPHLAKEQMDKKVREAVTGEGLNILAGSIPCSDVQTKERIKAHLLELLQSKYGISEEDFVSAELEAVPAGNAREVGFDRGLIGAYGHDDRACVYTSLQALLANPDPEYTTVALFADKEETGSAGATGMKSKLLEDFVLELGALQQKDFNYTSLRRALRRSKALSADVTVAFDPTYGDVTEKLNTAFVGKGVVISKYSGVGGKYDTSDANAEFVAEVRGIFNGAGIAWQTGELGKVDQGGGGTIAQYLARYGMNVLDCGPAVLSLHAPFELISTVDLYMTYPAYRAFFAN